jgi:hypothetical protein
MAIEHARICGACERETPGWAHRCPACGSTAIISRITLVPPSAPITAIADAKTPRSQSHRRRAAGREPPRTTTARSTA